MKIISASVSISGLVAASEGHGGYFFIIFFPFLDIGIFDDEYRKVLDFLKGVNVI